MRIAPILVCMLLVACTTTDPNYDKYADKHSAYQLVDRDRFENINLVSLISGVQGTARSADKTINDAKLSKDDKAGLEIDNAFHDFADKYRNAGDAGRARRNEIQERILGASDQRCNDFKTLLQKKQANVNFLTGLATTTTSVAATIVTNIDRSKLLSGLAGISSGYRAEYNQAFFANAAALVIVAGIDSRRRTAYEQIMQARKEGLVNYPLEAAVKDGIRYHGLCSTVAGLQEAGEAVRYYNEPGLTAAARTVARSKMLVDLQEAKPTEVAEKLAAWQKVVPVERYLAGNPLGEFGLADETSAQSLMDHFGDSLGQVLLRSSKLQENTKAQASDPDWRTDLATAYGIAANVTQTLETKCKPELLERAKILLDAKSRQGIASPNNDTIALGITLAEQNVRMVLASTDFIVAGYMERANALDSAIGALGTPPDSGKRPTVTAALKALNLYKPTIADGCKVESLETKPAADAGKK